MYILNSFNRNFERQSAAYNMDNKKTHIDRSYAGLIKASLLKSNPKNTPITFRIDYAIITKISENNPIYKRFSQIRK